MAIESGIRPQGVQQPGTRGYETRDANISWIFGIVAFLIVCGIIIHFALIGLLGHLKATHNPTDAWRPSQKVARPEQQSFPRLQVSPRLDLKTFRAGEDEQLTNYGWINRSSGIVRVPIEHAMELVLSKGLPVRTNNQDVKGLSPEQLIRQRSVLPPQRPADK
ncbi:MAG TPA: hypothetical protein VL793_13775 [Patescibacteria group bacterium]|nr:hypothetical protein [Patescibacteria group bacterium]